MEFEERVRVLETQYAKLPIEMKQMNRWVCFNKSDIKLSEDAIIPAKVPLNALNGKPARSNDDMTWTNFRTAIRGCAKFGFDGIGFMLGNGVFGVDLDNHIDPKTGLKPYTKDEFDDLIHEFVSDLNSYSERSQSGDGVHIICKGFLPENANNRAVGVGVEMYDNTRYFAMTGNVINDMSIMPRTGEIIPLWKKYLEQKSTFNNNVYEKQFGASFEDGKLTFGDGIENECNFTSSLSDSEIIQKIQSSKNGYDFIRLFNGNMESYDNDHSAADMGLCSILAFWCNRDKAQMDRIFRQSSLMREKWDRRTGNSTYGERTLDLAIRNTSDTYTAPREREYVVPQTTKIETVQANNIVAQNNKCESTFDENGEPIIKFKKIFKSYSLDDTGNAERFYDQFGELFHYNVTDKVFMIWTGKSWVKDVRNVIRKYANALIEVFKSEANEYNDKIKDALKDGNEAEAKRLEKVQDAMFKNAQRVSNKAGKDAMLDEFKTLYEIPVESSEFDKDDFVLNTASGVVDLKTGEIKPFDKKMLLSQNTHCEVSYEEPETWLKFLNSIFERGNPQETKEIIECMQQTLGYMLTGTTREQVMFIAYGAGRNGKSTLFEQFLHVCGDYGTVSSTDVIMQNKNAGNQMFSLAKLMGKRFVSIEETDENGRLAESATKRLTGSTSISAQYKFGNEFEFKPKFKICTNTNDKPIIAGKNLGIWRRIFPFPFTRSFTEEQTDKRMPDKLLAESDKILGWCIQGSIKYLNNEKGLTMPQCMEQAKSDYKTEMDTVQIYLNSNCTIAPGCETKARDLFQDYKIWAKDNNEYDRIKETQFSAELIEKGFTKVRRSDGIHYLGLKMNSDTRIMVFTDDEE